MTKGRAKLTESWASGQGFIAAIAHIAARASTQPTVAPAPITQGSCISTPSGSGCVSRRTRADRNTENSAIAAASFSRLSPSTIRARRCGAGVARKMPTTADGSVVDTIAPSSRQASKGNSAKGIRAAAITSVAAKTAITASDSTGTQSSISRRRFSVSETWNSRIGSST